LRQVKVRLKAEVIEVVCASVETVWKGLAPASLDLVFLDPAYGRGLLGPALAAATRAVAPGGWAYAEDERPLSEVPASWVLRRQGRAGIVHHHLLQRVSEAHEAFPPGPG
jgi:16S rRNA G966 N2-methylase RsmD